MKVNGIEITQEEIAEALEHAKKHGKDSLVHVPDGHGGSMPLTVVCKAEFSEDGRVANVQRNIKRDTPRFLSIPGLLGQRQHPIAIVGGGPSVRNYLDEIRKFRFVMAAGSAHDFLVENGIIPTFAVITDPKDECNDYFQRLQEKTLYIVASQCSPKLFDRLADGYHAAMWHFHDQVDPEHYQGEAAICWGCMVGINCIQLALIIGFQHQHYFGYDCSLDGEASHAYEVGAHEKVQVREAFTTAEIGDAKIKFNTTTPLICQATHFLAIYRSPDGNYLKGHVYGPGMLAEIIRQSPPEMSHWLEAA